MSAYPKATIIVPTYNRSHFIEKSFSALVNQNYPKDRLEIIAIDDGSIDRTPEILRRFQSEYPYFRYFTQPNRGPATARNLGLRHARGEIILFIDDDCIADENWALELARAYQSAEVAGIAGRIVYVPPADNLANRIAAHANGNGQAVGPDGEVAFFVTANASFKRGVLEQMGGFDETFPHAVHEDVDLSRRVKQAGWKLQYCDRAVVHHYHHYTIKGNLKKWYQLGNALALYHLKHALATPVWSAVPVSLLAFVRIPFGFVRNLTKGLGIKQSFMLPVFHRLHNLMIAAGMFKGHRRYRSLFKRQAVVNGQSQHAIIQHLLHTRVEEHVDGHTLPVYGDDSASKLSRIQMDIERLLFTLQTIRQDYADPSQIRILELGANPYFLTELIQKHLGSDIQTNGSPLGICGADGQEARSGGVSFTNPEAQISRTIANQLFNVEEDPFPYATASFDLVICQELIEHLLFSPTFMLNEIHRVLKRGGKVIISCPNIARIDVLRKILANKNPIWGYVRSATPPNRAMADWPTRHGVYGRHNRELALAELEDLVRGCGFKILRAECVTFQLPKVQINPLKPGLFFRTLVYRLMKSATFLPLRFLQAKKDTVFIVAEKDRDEAVAYYPQSLYGEWQVQDTST